MKVWVNDMNLPDINEKYPQKEPIQFFKCIACGIEIFEGEEYIEHGGNAFCDMACLSNTLLSEGNAERRIAGE